MAKRRRLSPADREQREAAYRAWVAHDRDYPATAAEEAAPALARIAQLRRVADELAALEPLIDGTGASGGRLYVPPEMQIEAISQALNAVLGLGGVFAETVRADATGMLPKALVVLAGIALGVDRDGQPRPSDPAARAEAAEAAGLLVRSGFATRAEIGTLTLPELASRIHDRLRAVGVEVEPEPQA